MKPTRERIILATIVSLILLIFFGAWGRVRTGPPRKIVFAAGEKTGAYYKSAEEYKKLLAESGLEVEILETKGSRDNLRLLENGTADIGFVQSGLRGKSSEQLQALGSVYFEPVWVFVRGDAPSNELLSLKNKRVAVGSEGSGTLDLSVTLLQDNNLLNSVKPKRIGGLEAASQLLNGELDAVFIVGAASIPEVKTLAHTKGINLINFERAEAYSRFHDSLTAVTLYRGMINLAADIPSKDLELVATSANLVVTDTFHYALVTLLLQTARKIHRPAGPFHSYGEFPNPRVTTFPLVPEADSFYQRGPSFFYRNLPFYLAAALDRLIIIILPLLTLLIPLGRLVPPLYGWFLHRRIYKMQDELAEIEVNADGLTQEELLSRTVALREKLVDVKTLPPAYQNDVFLLQLRLERVIEALNQRIAQEGETDGPNDLINPSAEEVRPV